MEELKVRKKDPIISNVVFYLLLSFAFLYLQYAYRNHISPFSLVYLRKSVELFWYVTLPLAFSCLAIWKLKRFALASYSFCIGLVSYKVVEGLFIEFNKIIVIALFFYVVISYFLYQLLKYYLSLANINANYSPDDLFDPMLKLIPCTLVTGEHHQVGFLTNWDEVGCFIKMAEPQKMSSRVDVRIDFKGRSFSQQGEVVAHSRDLCGVGIKFSHTAKDLTKFNWEEFTELVHELGFRPERLR
jgi:hypothetical protein